MLKRAFCGLFFAFGLLFVLTSPLLVALGIVATETAWFCFVSGIVIAIMSRMDSVVELSFGPLKAKMEKATQDASNATLNLNNMIKTIARYSLTENISGYYAFGMSFDRRIMLHDQIVNSLKGMGFSDKDVKEVSDYWIRGVSQIYIREIKKSICDTTQDKHEDDVRCDEAKEVLKILDGLCDYSKWEFPSPDTIERLLNMKIKIKDQTKELIDDYRHHIETGNIKNVTRLLALTGSH